MDAADRLHLILQREDAVVAKNSGRLLHDDPLSNSGSLAQVTGKLTRAPLGTTDTSLHKAVVRSPMLPLFSCITNVMGKALVLFAALARLGPL